MINLQELKVGDIITGIHDNSRDTSWVRGKDLYYLIVKLKYSDEEIVGFKAKILSSSNKGYKSIIGKYFNRNNSTNPQEDYNYVS